MLCMSLPEVNQTGRLKNKVAVCGAQAEFNIKLLLINNILWKCILKYLKYYKMPVDPWGKKKKRPHPFPLILLMCSPLQAVIGLTLPNSFHMSCYISLINSSWSPAMGKGAGVRFRVTHCVWHRSEPKMDGEHPEICLDSFVKNKKITLSLNILLICSLSTLLLFALM